MTFLCYQIRHSTLYSYSSTVTQADHLVKLRPRDLLTQRCLSHDLKVSPGTGSVRWHTDYFGNECAVMSVDGAHNQLEITATSRVAVGMPFLPAPSETPSWETVRGQVMTDRAAKGLEAMEYTYDSSQIDPNLGIADYAKVSFTKGRPILDAAKELTRRIFDDFAFDPTATTVSTPVSEVFKKRRGVCQDFAHFQIACLRSLGLSARYVSGYLETDPPPGGTKLVGADASHAWVSFYCPGIGWIDLDPTNGCLPSLRHITIGWGRDYGDICPVRGVIHGGGDHVLSVGVDVIAEGNMEIPYKSDGRSHPHSPLPK